jgi:hypothetical protein
MMSVFRMVAIGLISAFLLAMSAGGRAVEWLSRHLLGRFLLGALAYMVLGVFVLLLCFACSLVEGDRGSLRDAPDAPARYENGRG